MSIANPVEEAGSPTASAWGGCHKMDEERRLLLKKIILAVVLIALLLIGYAIGNIEKNECHQPKPVSIIIRSSNEEIKELLNSTNITEEKENVNRRTNS